MDAAVREPTAEMSEAKQRRKSIEPAVDVPCADAKSTAQPATDPSPNGGVAMQQPSMKKEPDYDHNDRIVLESMENKQWKSARGGVFNTLHGDDGVKLQAYKSNRKHQSPGRVHLKTHEQEILVDSSGNLLEMELVMRHGVTCFLVPSSLMALRAIGRRGHAIAAASIRKLSVANLVFYVSAPNPWYPWEDARRTELSIAELLKETRDDVRDLVQAFIEGALPLRKFAVYFLNLVTAETNPGEQRKMLIAISQFESGQISDHEAFCNIARAWYECSRHIDLRWLILNVYYHYERPRKIVLEPYYERPFIRRGLWFGKRGRPMASMRESRY